MKQTIRLLAFAATLAGGATLARPTPATAMVAPRPTSLFGVTFCCWSTDKTKSCCFDTGCATSANGCWQLR